MPLQEWESADRAAANAYRKGYERQGAVQDSEDTMPDIGYPKSPSIENVMETLHKETEEFLPLLKALEERLQPVLRVDTEAVNEVHPNVTAPTPVVSPMQCYLLDREQQIRRAKRILRRIMERIDL